MKRYISLVCIALVIVTCMVSPVSAVDFDSYWGLELLNYSTVNDSGSNMFHFSNSTEININLPEMSYYTQYIDVVFAVTSGAIPNSIRSRWNNNYDDLTIVNLGSNYYRAYGTVRVSTYYFISLQFNTGSNSDTFIEILSCRIRGNIPTFDNDAYCQIVANEYDKTIHYVPTDEINYRLFPTSSEEPADQWLTLYIWSDNWKSYDYLEFNLFLVCEDINSINAVMGSNSIPIQVSNIYSQNGWDYHYNVSIFLDLSDLDRTSSDYPMIVLEGKTIPGLDSINSVNFVSCIGGLDISTPVYIPWFRRIVNSINSNFNSLNSWISSQTDIITSSIYNWIINQTASISGYFDYQNGIINVFIDRVGEWLSDQTIQLVNAIRGDTAPGDSFQQEVDQKDQQFNDMAAVMDSVNKPQIDSVNVSADTYVDQTVLATSMSGLTAVISMPVFLDVIMMALIMATAGYVLFGKR